MTRKDVRFITERGTRLCVIAGALAIKHGDKIEFFDPGRHRLHTIIVDTELGISITSAAVAWLGEEKVELLIAGSGTGDITIFTPQPLSDSSRTALRYRKSQWRAVFDRTKLVNIARCIVLRKILESGYDEADGEEFNRLLSVAKTPSHIRHIEAKAAALWWRSWRGFEMKFLSEVPSSWRQFEGRYMGRLQGRIGDLPRQWTPRGATTPMSALHNYALGVTAARATRALSALGLDVAMGFLHDGLKPGRPSLSWDLVEVWRPQLGRAVFKYIGDHSFARDDFRVTGRQVRLGPAVAADMARMTIGAVPSSILIREARWLIKLF